MTNQNPDFFTNRSTTQEFLFSHSKDHAGPTHERTASDADENASADALRENYPEMLGREELIHAIDTKMAAVSSLVSIALEFRKPATTLSDNEQTAVFTKQAIQPVADFCRAHTGIWAYIGTHRFACVFPNLSENEGRALAEELLASVSADRPPELTLGVAAYPTINYARSQVVANAEKALDHADFFDDGTITTFDAVSLNISGDRLYQAGDIAGAIGEYKKGLLLHPTDVNLQNSLGVCYGVLKKFDPALTAFENAIWLAPEEVMPLYNKGYVLLSKGEKKEALGCFLEANRLEPDVFEIVFHIGQTFMENGDPEKARSFLENAVKANSRSGTAMKSLGNCLGQLGLTKKAIQAYKKAVKINPSDAQSLSSLGQLYLQLGESLDVASVLCDQSVRLAPDNGLFRFRLGCSYLHRDLLDLALTEFEEAQALGHDSQTEIEEIHGRMMDVKAS